ncbi:hypothetical protein FACS1894176_08730 [Bacteroidia bacterium]|nr:hypothetical protein FACS1894176_08730 [Bacteroidia bacterium]
MKLSQTKVMMVIGLLLLCSGCDLKREDNLKQLGYTPSVLAEPVMFGISQEEFQSTDYEALSFIVNWYHKRKPLLRRNYKNAGLPMSMAKKELQYFLQENIRLEVKLVANLRHRSEQVAGYVERKETTSIEEITKTVQSGGETLSEKVIKQKEEKTISFTKILISAENTPYWGSSFYDHPLLFTMIHERTHAFYLQGPMQLITQQIEEYRRGNKDFIQSGDNLDKYYDDPDEIKSRLMETRAYLGLDPRKKISLQEVKQLQQEQSLQDQFCIISRYSADFLLFLFNEVA